MVDLDARLAAARKDLLDLSARNRLISTPRGSGRSSRLEIVGETCDDVFQRLVTEQKATTFAPAADKPEPAESAAPGSDADLRSQPAEEQEPGETARRADDNRLQTRLDSESLQKALLKLYYDARTYEEEQGVNILYLAVGFLKWFEDERSTKERFAPLVLIPVSLARRTAGVRFRLAWTQDDIATNLSLQEKLRLEFGVQLPELPPTDDLVPSEYFAKVAEAVAPKSRWEVLRDDMVLWFFSFSKFLMYRDLDPAVWPADRGLDRNVLVTSLMGNGFRSTPPICGSTENIDKIFPVAETIHVDNADSSQTIAIEEVRRGNNLVIQGPPGTGKSQTIMNLIAATVKDGKRVLFVAEKMAALEVVKRRLDNIGLGDMCLELHSHKANKRAVLEELKRTMALGGSEPALAGVEEQAKRLADVRAMLNRHADAMHAPLGPSGVTAFRAVGNLVRLRAEKAGAPRFALPQCLEWSAEQFGRKTAIVRDVVQQIGRLGNPPAHPWRGVQAVGLLPNDVTMLLGKLPPIREMIAKLRTAANVLGEQLGAAPAATPLQLAETAKLAQQLASAPPLDREALTHEVWSLSRNEIDKVIEHGLEFAEVKRKLEGVVTDAAWDTDVVGIRRDLGDWGRSWIRLLSRRYRTASAAFAQLLTGAPPRAVAERIQLLDELIRGQKARRELQQREDIGRDAFGTLWRGEDSDWAALQAIAKWERDSAAVEQRQQGPRSNFRKMAVSISDTNALTAAVSEVAQHVKPMLQALERAVAPLQFDVQQAFGAPELHQVPLDRLDAALAGWASRPDALAAWTAYSARITALGTEGLAELALLLDGGELEAAAAESQLELAYYETFLREAFRRYPNLAAFDGLSHEQVLERFKSLDVERLKLTRQEVAYAHYRNIPRSGGDAGELGVLKHEMNKKRNHLPIRQLLVRAGHAVQALKPVFMMSPISVAQFLEPGFLEFDLLLIDEASQVEPVDALGAMARSEQVAVVGDDRQLPPTRFFLKMLGDDGTDDDEDETPTADLESILGLCRAQGMRDAMLRWHYRSRHQSLIAVSNHEFYNDELYVVPSPERISNRLGLRFHHVAEGRFDRGKSATNRIEAAAVVDAVMEHARRCPNKTLGVAAFSVAQRDAILDELELRRRKHHELESFFATGGAEPFFVKNLENVQGDERDVIFISVGYGKDASGYPSMNFGPVQNDGGERRLNVLISRAKERCEVFSSILGDEIDLNRARSRGAKALKTFLRYAQLGELDVATRTERDYESEFEREVGTAIQNLGYEVHPQVGLAGFYIDLAVVDPENSGRYLLGIECDGAEYHSSRSARDRDRLRQQVLEDRGWVIHRIWSTDWFKQPDEQLRQVVAAIEKAKIEWAARETRTKDDCGPPVKSQHVANIERQELVEANVAASNSMSVPYVEAAFRVSTKRDVHELPVKELAEIVTRIVEIEGPIHEEEIGRRVASLWGLKRLGNRVEEAVARARAEAAAAGAIRASGPFYRHSAQETVPVRDRSEASPQLLKAEHLPPEEIRATVTAVVRAHFGMSEEEAVGEAARVLGYRRVSPQVRELVGGIVRQMLEEQLLCCRIEMLYVADEEDGG